VSGPGDEGDLGSVEEEEVDVELVLERVPPPVSPEFASGAVDRALDEALHLAGAIFPDYLLCREQGRGVLERARVAVEKGYGPASAKKWAEDQGWRGLPEAVVQTDEEEFRRLGGSFVRMAKERQAKIAPNRLSVERVGRVISQDNPEREKLLLLCPGMEVTHAEEFVPNAGENWPPLFKSYRDNKAAVDCLLHESHKKGHGFMLWRSTIEELGLEAHINPAGLVVADKPEGRMITNLSHGNPSLNSDWAKEWADERYGVIEHPTIDTIVRLVAGFLEVHPEATADELVFFKMDINARGPSLSFSSRPRVCICRAWASLRPWWWRAPRPMWIVLTSPWWVTSGHVRCPRRSRWSRGDCCSRSVMMRVSKR
jgi:hypothetical protein